MIDPGSYLLFLPGALLLAVTPGPDVAFTMATAARAGTRAGLAASAGICCGSLVWSILTAVGLAALLAATDHALVLIRIAGGFYLLVLAAKAIEALDDPALMKAKGSGTAARAFRDGAMTNLLNPKVGIFFIAFLPAFASAEAGPIWPQILLLGATFSVIGTLVLFVYAAAAGAIRERLEKSRSLRQAMNATAAAAFAGLGMRLIFTRPT